MSFISIGYNWSLYFVIADFVNLDNPLYAYGKKSKNEVKFTHP